MRTLLPLTLLFAAAACATAPVKTEGTASIVTEASAVEWQHLNPARGDAAPKAGTLWGDRNGTGPTGFLLKPADGFESPPHIHNVSYRGVVIRGVIHNDDPKAGELWMPAGSFWTQPKGHVHITAAKGRDTLAYIEIDEGPYLVRPVASAFETEQKPVNVDASNVVWVDAASLAWREQPRADGDSTGARVAFLWGAPQTDRPSGVMVKLNAGSTVLMRGHGATFRAVVVQGNAVVRAAEATTATTLGPGGYFTDRNAVRVSCDPGQHCVAYVRMDGRFDVVSQ